MNYILLKTVHIVLKPLLSEIHEILMVTPYFLVGKFEILFTVLSRFALWPQNQKRKNKKQREKKDDAPREVRLLMSGFTVVEHSNCKFC
ncbi:hypothetical protein P5673_021254 [Acropora cervicornis]|uniref:Uncharacterized protein n=1 Tax=Acropora cervicornis TaxID=6130 RepID=A0AAD9Q975_ACRCE|nr:hypothetical protein P5673_021254 [Acropora cervicornis]